MFGNAKVKPEVDIAVSEDERRITTTITAPPYRAVQLVQDMTDTTPSSPAPQYHGRLAGLEWCEPHLSGAERRFKAKAEAADGITHLLVINEMSVGFGSGPSDTVEVLYCLEIAERDFLKTLILRPGLGWRATLVPSDFGPKYNDD